MAGNFDYYNDSAFYDMESFSYWPTEKIYGMADECTHAKYSCVTYRKRVCNHFKYAKVISGQNNTEYPDSPGIDRKIYGS